MELDISGSMARDIMLEFAADTGLEPVSAAPRRYLWTDAFAVCNFLELHRLTGDDKFSKLALRLVDQVHYTLGRHRPDDSRTGWISGLGEEEGRRHPTRGGLRIGKELGERGAAEPFDETLEWERDGQYYHYLTKWMHALNRVTRVTGDPAFNRWAIELAKAAHAGFIHTTSPKAGKRMYWKTSIDLSYPLVSSMGHHDPLDGFITCLQLQSTAADTGEKEASLDLGAEIDDMADMCAGKSWTTDDPLGIGELLGSAFRLAQLIVDENLEETGLLEELMKSCLAGLEIYAKRNQLKLPADYRLAFRELGLSIGLLGAEKLHELVDDAPVFRTLLEPAAGLARYGPLGDMITTFWLGPANRRANSWLDHRAINMVMLATSLTPGGYLVLG